MLRPSLTSPVPASPPQPSRPPARPPPQATSTWDFPQAVPAAGESVRAAAERALRLALGSSVSAYFVGNAPAAHWAVPAAADGRPATLFYHTAQLLPDSRPALEPAGVSGATELAWVTRGELAGVAGLSPDHAAYMSDALPGVRPSREPKLAIAEAYGRVAPPPRGGEEGKGGGVEGREGEPGAVPGGKGGAAGGKKVKSAATESKKKAAAGEGEKKQRKKGKDSDQPAAGGPGAGEPTAA